MKFIIQVRKDVNDSGLIDASRNNRSEKEWVNKEETFDSMDAAIMEAQSCIHREIHKARNIRVTAVVAEFETKVIVEAEEVPPS